MQLKKLTLQAFGPFKDKVVIDFENEKIDKGLLLISGDTGAGKTTLFDAICFALYGQTSGETRTANSLRSDWASPEDDTFVDLEFYYKDKMYEIKRSPEFFRKKKNRDGETKQLPTAEFEINGRVITKVNEATKEIENLIGLDYKQFRQVAMLSQGEFTKFLLASSEEKTTIFRKIFGTDLYDRLQNRLKLDRLKIEDELKSVKEKIDTERANLEPIINLYGLNLDETINVLDNKIKEDTEIVANTKLERDKKNEEKTKLTNELKNLSDTNQKIEDYNNSKEKLDKLISENESIEQEREKYNYNITIARYISDVLKEWEKDNKSLEEKKEKHKQSKKELEEKETIFKSREEQYSNLKNYSHNVDKLNNEISGLNDKIKEYDNYLNKKSALEKVEKEYQINSKEYEKQNIFYENMRKEYYLNISVEIAETLEEGSPCPVCGSTLHPNKALAHDCDYTKEDLEKAEKELKQVDSKRKSNEASIEEIRNTIKELEIPKDIDVNDEKKKLNELLSQKKEEKEKLDKEFNELSKEKEELNSIINSLKDNLKIFDDDIVTLENSINEANQSLEKLYRENRTSHDEYLCKKLEKDTLVELKEKIEDFDKKKQELETKIKLLEDEVKDKQIIDISVKKKEFDTVDEEYKNIDEKYTNLNAILEKVKSSTKNIKEFIGENKQKEKKYTVIKLLSDTANGNLNGRQKITFENYVQSYYMNTVLVEANKRLEKMTDGRYELKKKELDIKHNIKSGLDFSIYDSYTGKERDVSTLSGGEKFKASLALALGLSDSISNNRGGIRINSLFIDEGFGSLDSESLNQALNILLDLSGNDKLVGVISHVSELMTIIDNKILVNKSSVGSVVKIESNN